MSITITDEISGRPVVIENPLLREHIKIDALLWYNGFTSTGSWSCPAIITEVDKRKERFRVRSLDDMREQSSWYSFSADKDLSGARKTMRIVDAAEVREYLDRRRSALVEDVEAARSAFNTAEFDLKGFDTVRSKLPL